MALLDSRAYGSPQRRVRCFVLAARSGVPLPRFPEPTHASPKPAGMRVVIGDDGKKEVTVYSCPQGVTPGTGPYAPVTAQEAISDLPGASVVTELPVSCSYAALQPLISHRQDRHLLKAAADDLASLPWSARRARPLASASTSLPAIYLRRRTRFSGA